MNNTLIKPIVTEKSMNLAVLGMFTFRANVSADKTHIAQEIHTLYGVTVKEVRTMKMHGKVRRSGRRALPHTLPDWKKVIVRLSKGQTIDAFTLKTEKNEEKGK